MNFLQLFSVVFVFQSTIHKSLSASTDNLNNKKNLDLADNQAIFIYIHAPATLNVDEILKVQYSISNNLKINISAQIEITAENGLLMTKNSKLSQKNPKIILNQNLIENSSSDWQHFWVKASKLGQLKIQIKLFTENLTHEVEKSIKVKSRDELEDVKSESWILLDLKDGEQFEKEIDLWKPKSSGEFDVLVKINDNLLDFMVDGLYRMKSIPMDYIEQKLDKFIIYFIILDFLKANIIENYEEFDNKLLNSYHEALKFLKSLDEKALKHPLMTLWIQSYAISAIINAKKFINIDNFEVERSLDYLGSKQNTDGSFTDDPVAYVRREMGRADAQKYILTANILLTFIKYQKYSDKYAEVITKGLNFLKASKSDLIDDYEKVIVAFTLAAANDQETSKFLTSNLKMDFLKPPKHKRDMAMFVETAAYLIMLKISHNENPKTEVEWLLHQIDNDNNFYSSYDTALAFDALSKYTMLKSKTELNMSYTFSSFNGKLTNERQNSSFFFQTEHPYNLSFNGTGFAFVRIIHKFFINVAKNSSTQENFSIDVKTKNIDDKMMEIEVDVKLVAEGINRTNLVMIEIEMPRGYEYTGHNHEDYIEMFESKNNKTLAVFYIDIMYTDVLYKEVIQAEKVYEIENYVDSSVRVYDYYQSNIKDELFYNINSKRIN